MRYVVEVAATARAHMLVEAKDADRAMEVALRRARAQSKIPGVFSVRESDRDSISVMRVDADNAQVEVD
jgi:MoxR-like ATPase